MKANWLFVGVLIIGAFAGGFFANEKLTARSDEAREFFVKELIAIRAEMASGDFTQVALSAAEKRYRVAVDTYFLKGKVATEGNFEAKRTCLEDADIDMHTASDIWFTADHCTDGAKKCSDLNLDSARMNNAATAKVGKCLNLFLARL